MEIKEYKFKARYRDKLSKLLKLAFKQQINDIYDLKKELEKLIESRNLDLESLKLEINDMKLALNLINELIEKDE